METESKIKVEISAVKHGTDPVSMAYTHNTANNGWSVTPRIHLNENFMTDFTHRCKAVALDIGLRFVILRQTSDSSEQLFKSDNEKIKTVKY